MIYGVSGQKVWEGKIEEATIIGLDLAGFQRGLYIYRFNSLKGVSLQGKLILQ